MMLWPFLTILTGIIDFWLEMHHSNFIVTALHENSLAENVAFMGRSGETAKKKTSVGAEKIDLSLPSCIFSSFGFLSHFLLLVQIGYSHYDNNS